MYGILLLCPLMAGIEKKLQEGGCGWRVQNGDGIVTRYYKTGFDCKAPGRKTSQAL